MAWSWDRRMMMPAVGVAAGLAAMLWLVGGSPAEEAKPAAAGTEKPSPAPTAIPAAAPAPIAAPAAKPAPAPASDPLLSQRPALRPAAPLPASDKPLAAPVAIPAPAFAPYTGTVTRSDVYLRSGPAQNYYPTGKVQIGDTLSVVGERIGWLEVKPPAGQFSWIDSHYVKCDAGALGRAVVTGDNVRVRAGSLLLPVSKDSVQTKLARGTVVEVIGEADGFSKVRPPEGATLWISGEFVAKPGAVAPVPPIPAAPKKADAAPIAGPAEGPAEAALPQPLPAEPAPVTVAEARPAVEDVPAAPINELETLYTAMSAELKKPVDKQDLDGLIGRFRALRGAAGNPKLREYCDYYLADLTRRRTLQGAYVEAERLRSQFEQDLDKTRARRPASRPAPVAVAAPPAPALPAAPLPRPVIADVSAKPAPIDLPAPVELPAPKKEVPAPKPAPKWDEATGYLLESSYWETYKDTLDGAVRYRLVQGLPPEDIYIVWVQAADKATDLSKHLGKKVSIRGTKVYLDRHRSHLLLVEDVAAAEK